MNQTSSDRPWGMETNTFCMLMHLSQLINFIIPFAGIILPVVMWATNKDQFPEVNKHGKLVFNWMISAFIYGVVCTVLTLIVIGAFGFIALGLCGLIFPIIGGVKANDGIFWHYPLTIKFFKIDDSTIV